MLAFLLDRNVSVYLFPYKDIKQSSKQKVQPNTVLKNKQMVQVTGVPGANSGHLGAARVLPVSPPPLVQTSFCLESEWQQRTVELLGKGAFLEGQVVS